MAKTTRFLKKVKSYVPLLAIIVVSAIAFTIFKLRKIEHFATATCNPVACNRRLTDYMSKGILYTTSSNLVECKGCPVVSYPKIVPSTAAGTVSTTPSTSNTTQATTKSSTSQASTTSAVSSSTPQKKCYNSIITKRGSLDWREPDNALPGVTPTNCKEKCIADSNCDAYATEGTSKNTYWCGLYKGVSEKDVRPTSQIPGNQIGTIGIKKYYSC